MSEDNMPSDSLQQAITLIKSGDKQNGRRLLAEIIKADPGNETAWLWMSSVLDNVDQRRHCLEQVLALNPHNQLAQKGLAKLQQYQAPSQPVDTPKQPTPPPAQTQSQTAQAPSPTIDKPTTTEPLKTSKDVAIRSLESQPKPPPSPSPAPESTIKPVKKRKNVWLNPNHLLTKIIVLYDNAVVAANPDDEVLKQVRAKLKTGTPNPKMLGEELEAVPIRSITMVSTNKRRKNLTIRYKKDKKPGLQTLYFANTADRDEFFAALQQRLGTGFECITREFNAFVALLFPIVIMAAVVYGTYLFHGAAVEIAGGAEPEIEGRGLEILLQFVFLLLVKLIGPTGMIILGVMLIGWILFWTVKRVMNPPIMMTLIPTSPGKAKSKTANTISEPIREELAAPVPDKVEPGPVDTPDIQPIPGPPKKVTKLKKADKSVKPRNKLAYGLLLGTILISVIVCAVGYVSIKLTTYPGLIKGGRVLDLSDRGLTAISLKEIPQDKLGIVDLSHNPITDLPPEISQFPQLFALYVTGTQLKQVPPEIGRLNNMGHLFLCNNQLTELPPEIGQLSNLENLNLSGNQITTLPPEIGQLSNLKWLSLSNNQLAELPPEIGQLSNLETLVLEGNQLTTLPPEIGQLTNLQLNLNGNPIKELPPEAEHLTIRDNLVSDCNYIRWDEYVLNFEDDFTQFMDSVRQTVTKLPPTSLPK
jgi:outer membrane biosynthesis protein TonB